jgi:cytosine/adenosine deaminase-related metal-dependent hydrolase
MIRSTLLAAVLILLAPQALAQAPDRTVITNVNIVTLDERGVIADGAVVIRDGQIERVLGPGQHRVRNATIVDGEGGYLIPGLIDSHVHYNADTELTAYLQYGVTTVLSLGTSGDLTPLLNARRDVASGARPGAHMYATGPLISNGVNLTTAEVEPFLDSLQRDGLEFVKVYNETPQEVFDAVVAGARRRGMGVFSHMPRRFPPEYALSHGVNVLAHMEEFFFTTFEGPRDRDLANLTPDWTPDYSRIDPILDIATQNNVAIIPNLVASYNFQNLWADESRQIETPDIAHISAEDAEGWRQQNYSRRPDQRLRQIREQIKYPLIRTMTYRAQQRGILLLAGTDAPIPALYPGRSLHEELRLLAAAGLTYEEALRAGTANAGTVIRRWVDSDACVGVIRAGCEADLVLLRGNPLDDIRQTEAIAWVMADGRRYTPEELEALARPR